MPQEQFDACMKTDRALDPKSHDDKKSKKWKDEDWEAYFIDMGMLPTREDRLRDLRILLASPNLSTWGVASLKDTLSALIPDLALSTIGE